VTPDRYGETSDAVRRVFTSYRTLDPIRGAALAAAVTARGYGLIDEGAAIASDVLAIAKEFEAYLTGEEANAS
jgi:hypothetical protein